MGIHSHNFVGATRGLGSVKVVKYRKNDPLLKRLPPMTYEEWCRLSDRIKGRKLSTHSPDERGRLYGAYLARYRRSEEASYGIANRNTNKETSEL
jgi:hypothetical protein